MTLQAVRPSFQLGFKPHIYFMVVMRFQHIVRVMRKMTENNRIILKIQEIQFCILKAKRVLSAKKSSAVEEHIRDMKTGGYPVIIQTRIRLQENTGPEGEF